MPYFQPNTTTIFGLQPLMGVPGQGQTGLYFVSSSEATAILPGDAIVQSSIGSYRAAVTADVTPLMGVAANALTTAEFAFGTRNLLMYDSPDQMYYVSNTSNATTPLMIGQNMALVTTSTNPGIPNSLLGRSKHAIGTVTSSAGVVKLVGLHPLETWSSNPGAGLKWVVRPANQHVANLTT